MIPWWYATAFVAIFTAIALSFRGALVKSAFAIIGAGYALALAQGFAPTSGVGTLRTATGFAASALLIAAGWRAARPRTKLVACILLIAAAPFRYWVMAWSYGGSSVMKTAHAAERPR